MTTSTSAPDPRRWRALFLLCTAQFLVILDTSIVGIALPALQRALGFDAAGLLGLLLAAMSVQSIVTGIGSLLSTYSA